jgi:hypothetical protein
VGVAGRSPCPTPTRRWPKPLPDADPSLADRIQPRELADFALSFRKGTRTVETRPLGLLGWIVSLTLAFAATPLVLAAFWWRSMPKHDEFLTVICCGIPLSFAIYGAVASFLRLRRIMQGNDRPLFPTWRTRRGWVAIFSALAAFGWLRTEGTLRAYADAQYGDACTLGGELPLWASTWLPSIIARADLQNVDFSYTPDDWQDFDQARAAFHRDWCKANDLPPAACGPVPIADVVVAPHQYRARLLWCAEFLEPLKDPPLSSTAFSCLKYFYEGHVRQAGVNSRMA